jgi:NADPH-dependent 2,4-dienoyl-CoA reductase/sulfur reductase-like enzyme
MAGEVEHLTVVGGSFIGCEMAAALLNAGKKVTMVFPEESPFRQMFPKTVSYELLRLFKEKGVTMIPGLKLSDLQCDDERCGVILEDGRQFESGGVIVGVGVEPNTELAESAGLKTEDGISVNRQLQTPDENIYAAGDGCRFFNPALGRTLRVEHEDHALKSGETAGRNMAGKKDSYDHLPSFYSTLFGADYEAVGVLDSSLQTEGIWNGIRQKGIWAYLEDRHVCGILMWNLSGQTDSARKLIADSAPLSPQQLRHHLETFLNENAE